jgi:serine/threonine-protein kinase
MSRVFVATETRLRRSVVVKVLSSELAMGVSAERFEREIQLAASLQQANIVPIHSAGDTEGIPYYTMPLVEGESLRARLGVHGRLPIAECVSILRDLARALSYAHARGVVHRDIKPDNILLSHGTAVVTDFGIAKAISAARTLAPGATLTQAGTSIGTPAYMAPEQVAGDPAADHRVDLYAFGCVAYELLSGQPPFTDTSPQKILAAHLTTAPQPVRTLRPDTPNSLASLVARCLEKPADSRPANADEVLRALEAIVTPSGAMSTSVAQSMARRAAWRRPALGAAVISVIALGSAAAFFAPKWMGGSAVAADKSIAVLPLANLSGDKANDFFGEGLAEEITGALAKAGLKVIGRGSARALAAQGLDAKAIASQLGVATVLQGSVQRDGDQVRISVTLMSGVDGSVKWREKYDRKLKDVFAVQDEIARAIANALQATLAPGAKGTLVHNETSDPEAHTLYLQGLYLWNRRNAPAIRQAIALLEQAVKRDPDYARAHAGIALAYMVLPFYTDDNADSLTARGAAAADRALTLDSTLAEAWTARAWGDAQHWNNARAEEEFQRAIGYDSTFATARFWHGLLLQHLGRNQDAEREMSAATLLEPTSLVILSAGQQLLMLEGRFRESVDATRRTLALDSTFFLTRLNLAEALSWTGEYDEAIRTFNAISAVPGVRPAEIQGATAFALARAGRVTEARAVITRLRRSIGDAIVPPGVLAAALFELGDRDEAIATLEAAVQRHDPWLFNWGGPQSPRYKKMRTDPRARGLLESTQRP